MKIPTFNRVCCCRYVVVDLRLEVSYLYDFGAPLLQDQQLQIIYEPDGVYCIYRYREVSTDLMVSEPEFPL